MVKQRVGVLMGGWGEERQVSLRTGEAVAHALVALGHEVVAVDAGPGLERVLREGRFDVAFLALHGRLGEDGAVQGMLEVMGVPYTGSGVLASALAMNKPFAKKLFALHNLPCARGYTASAGETLEVLLDRHGDMGYPVVVKPARGGSSVGLSLVQDAQALQGAVETAARHGGQALVERKAEGHEVTVALLGDQVLGSCEIAHGASAFDHVAKTTPGSRCLLPPRLPEARRTNVEALAAQAFRALGGRGYGRVDFICGDRDNDVVLEVNTLPGMTATSLFPKIAAHAGIPFPGLVQRILEKAALDSEEGRLAEQARPPAPSLRAAG